jgi:hypothetical protein
MKLHREGYRYIIIATVAWAILGYLTYHFLFTWPWIMYPLNFICFLLWAWVIGFSACRHAIFPLANKW